MAGVGMDLLHHDLGGGRDLHLLNLSTAVGGNFSDPAPTVALGLNPAAFEYHMSSNVSLMLGLPITATYDPNKGSWGVVVGPQLTLTFNTSPGGPPSSP